MKYENGKQIHGHSQSVTDSSLIHEPALDLSPHWQCVESCAPVGVYLHPDSDISEKKIYRKRSGHHRNEKRLSRKPKSDRNSYSSDLADFKAIKSINKSFNQHF